MCGLVGVISLQNNEVDVTELEQMNNSMYARGPDDAGVWLSANKNIALAHRRLAIIDITSAGHQPMFSHDQRYCIVFNGEIYNYIELRESLAAKGHQFHSHSDTEVLLAAYAEYGKEMLQYLRGMFAFAIWDAATNTLFLARDHFGIKPLYYLQHEGKLYFASQVKTLLQVKRPNFSKDPAGQTSFYLWGHIPDPYTLYREIKALPSGHYALIENNQFTIHPYFNLTHELAKAEQMYDHALPKQELYETLYQALDESLQMHFRADVPVGLFLSAGIDSSALLSLASRIPNLQHKLNTMTLQFSEYANSENDEAPYAELLAKHFGSSHVTRKIAREEFIAQRDNILIAMDQPTVDGVNTYFISQMAKEAGLKVALSGLGGDELLAGYVTFQQLPKLVNKLQFTRHIPGLAYMFRHLSAPFLKRYGISSKYAGLLDYGHSISQAYFLRRGLFMPWELAEVLDPDVFKEGLESLNHFCMLDGYIDGLKTARARIMTLESQCYMRDQLLRDTDWASMAHSIEIRVPFVDIKLWQTLFHNGAIFHLTKADMPSLTKLALPKEILERKKTGFNVPVNEWLLNQKTKGSSLKAWAKNVYRSFE